MKDLKELALAAKDYDEKWYDTNALLTGLIDNSPDAAFITAASPDVVLGLISQTEILQTALDDSDMELAAARAEIERLTAECELRRLEQDALKAKLAAYESRETVAWLHNEHQGWVVLMQPPDTGNWYPVFTAPGGKI